MTDGTLPPRDALVTALLRQVQAVALASEDIGVTFAGRHHLHITDFRALTAIYRADRDGQPLTARQLADSLHLSPGAVTYLVDRLTATGHVRRDTDPTDRRRVLLRFSEHGREVAAEFFGPLGRAHADVMNAYSDADLALCLRFLEDVNTSLGAFQRGIQQTE